MPDPWTFVMARGELAAPTARLLLDAAERAGLPASVVRSVYGGFEVPEKLLEHLNGPEEDVSDLIGEVPTTADADVTQDQTAPAKKTAAARRKR